MYDETNIIENEINEQDQEYFEAPAIDFSQVPSFKDVEVEISESLKCVNELAYTTRVKCINTETPFNFDKNEIDFNSQYDLGPGTPIEKLELTVGNNSIPRVSCAAHKLNVAVRQAFSLHNEFSLILSQLNKFNSEIRNSIELNKVILISFLLITCD